jgi:hypothetical protein
VQGGRRRRVRCVSDPVAPRACRIPRRVVRRRHVRVASRGTACVSRHVAPRACRIPRHRVRVASRGAVSVSRPAAPRLTSRRRRWCRRRWCRRRWCRRRVRRVRQPRRRVAACTLRVAIRMLHAPAARGPGARRAARRSARATGQPTRGTWGPGDGAGGRNRWSATRAVGPRAVVTGPAPSVILQISE